MQNATVAWRADAPERRIGNVNQPLRAAVSEVLPTDHSGQTGVAARMRAKVFWPIRLIVGFVSR